MTTTIKPFWANISDNEIADLKQRLKNARVPKFITDDPAVVNCDPYGGAGSPGFEQGIHPKYLEALMDRWLNKYDWRVHEARINSQPQFTATVQDLTIHFIHKRSSRPNAVPLIITHGWPGSFLEFYPVLDLLAEPEDPTAQAFHVVVPSMPGFGFSSVATRKGFKAEDIASVWVELMQLLGYQQFYAQGGDWGSEVTRQLGTKYPKIVKGIHLNCAFAGVPTSLWYLPKRILYNIFPLFVISFNELIGQYILKFFKEKESGYYAIQSTKPYTLGVGLNDSPAGLLAWIGEKFKFWAETSDLTEDKLDELLTNVSLYWFTGTITSSFRLYKEQRNILLSDYYIKVPTAVAIFPRELSQPPEEWLSYNHNLVHYKRYPKGGHFASLQEPQLLVEDIRAGIKAMQRYPRGRRGYYFARRVINFAIPVAILSAAVQYSGLARYIGQSQLFGWIVSSLKSVVGR